MKSTEITNVENFMSKMFLGVAFDSFMLCEASVTTHYTMSIDGHLVKATYPDDIYEALPMPKLCLWHDIKSSLIAFLGNSFIEKKAFPYKLKIIFSLTGEQTSKIISAAGLSMSSSEIEGLFINIRYEDNKLECITGTSLKTFTLDKSLENFFDKYTMDFIARIS